MNIKIILITSLTVLFLLGFGVYYLIQNSKNDEIVQSKPEMTDDSNKMMMEEETMESSMNHEKYVVYSNEALESAAGNRRVIFFYANWCPTCKPADEDLMQNSESLPDDVTVIRVNYNDTETDNEEKELAKKYGITYQHTYVQIDGNGNEIAKWNGGATDELLENLK